MTKSSSKKKNGVVKTIKNEVDRRANGGMRLRVRGNLGNNMVLRGNEMLESLVVPTVSTSMALGYPLVAGNTTARDSIVFANVAKNFQQYKYLPGTQLHYQPAVGLNTSGTIYVGLLENPEAIADWYLLNTASKIIYIKALSSVKSYPLWQEFVLPLIGTPRLKMFPTDTDVNFTLETDVTKSVQSVFVVGIDGFTSVTGATTVGRCYLQQNLQLEHLSNPVI